MRKKVSKRKPSIYKYIGISILIFCLAILISSLAEVAFVLTGAKNTEIINMEFIIGMTEGAVGAIAAGFVLYQLKGEEIVEKRENEIHEAEFYQHFISYWLETDKLFIAHPECRKYFYESADVSKLDKMSDEYQIVMAFAEYFDDLFVYSETEIKRLRVESHSIPKDQIKSYYTYITKMREMPVFLHYRECYGDWVNSMQK